MAAGAPRGDFKLVLNGVEQAKLPAIVEELMDVLNVDRRAATDMVANAPVVLMGGMTQPQAMVLRSHLVRLLRLGAKMTLTSEAVGKAKVIHWAAGPPVPRRPAHLFTCPSCGERFVVQRWQPAARPAPAAAAPAPPPPSAPAAAPPKEDVPVAAEAVPAELPEAAPAQAEPAQALDEGFLPEELGGPEAEVLPEEALIEEGLPEGLPEAEVAPVVLPEAAPFEEAPLITAEPIEAEPLEAEPIPAEPVSEPAPKPQPAPARPQPAAARPQPAAPKLQPAQPKPQPAAAKPQAAAARPAPKPQPDAPQGPRYDVSIAKVRGDKQGRLAELLAARLGITYDEAMAQCQRTVVVVCKEAPTAEADEWRRALVGIGLEPRIRKR